jgi:hypothetical protein
MQAANLHMAAVHTLRPRLRFSQGNIPGLDLRRIGSQAPGSNAAKTEELYG